VKPAEQQTKQRKVGAHRNIKLKQQRGGTRTRSTC